MCCARAGSVRQEPKSPYSHSKEKKARPDFHFHFHFHFIRSHKPRYRIRANPDKTEILYVRIPDEKQEIQSNFLVPAAKLANSKGLFNHVKKSSSLNWRQVEVWLLGIVPIDSWIVLRVSNAVLNHCVTNRDNHL